MFEDSEQEAKDIKNKNLLQVPKPKRTDQVTKLSELIGFGWGVVVLYILLTNCLFDISKKEDSYLVFI